MKRVAPSSKTPTPAPSSRRAISPPRTSSTTVFEPCDRNWRGIGTIPNSGWRLRAEYAPYDAAQRFAVSHIQTVESPLCHAGEVLKGVIKPNQCPAFGQECTPRKPLGAPMVSAEGACAAYYNFGRFERV